MNKNNPYRGLGKIAMEHSIPLQDVVDIHMKFQYRLNMRGKVYTQEQTKINETYAVDLTDRYYRIKLGENRN